VKLTIPFHLLLRFRMRGATPPFCHTSSRRGTQLSIGAKLPLYFTLRVFENRVLRRKFGPKREKVNGGGCIMRSSSPSINMSKLRSMKWMKFVVPLGKQELRIKI
jgi:hypothetical protein